MATTDTDDVHVMHIAWDDLVIQTAMEKAFGPLMTPLRTTNTRCGMRVAIKYVSRTIDGATCSDCKRDKRRELRLIKLLKQAEQDDD